MALDLIFETTTPASLSPILLQKQHQWPIIARDLALLSTPQMGTAYSVEDIGKAYGLTVTEMLVLLEIPAFKQYVKDEKGKLSSDPHGGSKARAELIAADIQEVLYLRAKEGTISDIVILKFLEHLDKVSGLVDPKDKGSVNQNAISVTVNVPRLNNPKLAHLYPVEEITYDGEE